MMREVWASSHSVRIIVQSGATRVAYTLTIVISTKEKKSLQADGRARLAPQHAVILKAKPKNPPAKPVRASVRRDHRTRVELPQCPTPSDALRAKTLGYAQSDGSGEIVRSLPNSKPGHPHDRA